MIGIVDSEGLKVLDCPCWLTLPDFSAKEQFICDCGRSNSILCSIIFGWHPDGDAVELVADLSIDVGEGPVEFLVPNQGGVIKNQRVAVTS